jgi:hypothetical protein
VRPSSALRPRSGGSATGTAPGARPGGRRTCSPPDLPRGAARRGLSGGRHEAAPTEVLDSPDIDRAPPAAPPPRREPDGEARVKRPHQPLDPPEAEHLAHRVAERQSSAAGSALEREPRLAGARVVRCQPFAEGGGIVEGDRIRPGAVGSRAAGHVGKMLHRAREPCVPSAAIGRSGLPLRRSPATLAEVLGSRSREAGVPVP